MLIIRLCAYAVVVTLLFVALVLIEVSTPDGLRLWQLSEMAATLGTSEWSPVEWLQIAALMMIAGLAILAAQWQPGQVALSRLTLAMAVGATIRELDLFLDFYFVDHLWQVLIAVLFAVTGVYLWRNKRSLVRAVQRAAITPAPNLVFAGFVVIIFANLLGHAPFWQSILGDAYLRGAKLAAEEMTELLGYCFWLLGQLEYALDCRSRYLVRQGRSVKKSP
ncbi:MAG: hypothetical protein AAFO81_08540 [Pseudomonadota bacterium]